MNSEQEHEFVTVKDRRWCLGCDLFQTHKVISNMGLRCGWVPIKYGPCPRNTPYAQQSTDKRKVGDK